MGLAQIGGVSKMSSGFMEFPHKSRAAASKTRQFAFRFLRQETRLETAHKCHNPTTALSTSLHRSCFFQVDAHDTTFSQGPPNEKEQEPYC